MITPQNEGIARNLRPTDFGVARSWPGGQHALFEQQDHRCVSLELAALNELVAQLVEQRPFKAWVLGSSPSELTTLPAAASHSNGIGSASPYPFSGRRQPLQRWHRCQELLRELLAVFIQ